MSEWWTYRLSDFLMFSPTIYWRLVERYNREVWPLQVPMFLAGALLFWLSAARHPAAQRVVPAVLAAVWLWVGWAFHWQRYATINWAAQYLAAAFAVQAALLIGVAMMFGAGGETAATGSRARPLGLLLAAFGVLLYPLAGALAGRPWQQAEVFGLMPEPTALATLGLLLATRQSRRRWLLIIPALSLAAGWTTLWLLTQR
jgi:hypothetical protein